MSNPWKDYLQNFRDNLPAGVTYREDIARYVFNDKRFILPNDVVRYKNYLEKLGFSAFDPDALAYLTAVETADGEALEDDVKDAINDFVVGCKDDAIWDALKASCILAGARTLNGCLVPLVGTAPTNFNFVSGDYNRKTGLKGDGSTKYLDSNRANNADPQDSNHNAFWVSLSATGGGATIRHKMSSDPEAVPGFNNFFTRGTDLFAGSRLPDNINRLNLSGQGNGTTGFKGHSRGAAGGYAVRSGGANTAATAASTTPTATNVIIFDRGPTPPNAPTDARLSFYSIGESIDLAALDARVSTLMTAIDGAIT